MMECRSLIVTLLPILIDLLARLMPLYPILVLVGGALWALGPILTSLHFLLSMLNAAFGLLGINIGAVIAAKGMLGAILTTILPILGAVLYVVLGLVAWWRELGNVFNQTIRPALSALFEAFGRLQEALGVQITWWDLLKAATFPVYVLLTGLIVIISSLIRLFALLIEKIAEFINWIKGAAEWLTKLLTGGSPEGLYDAIEAMRQLRIETMRTGRTFRELRWLAPPAVGIPRVPPAYAAPVPIYVPTTIYIGEITGEIDIAALQEAVTRGIAEALERERLVWR